MPKATSIVCYVLSGFFFYTTCLLAFIGAFPVGMKYGVMSIFLVPALVFLLVGLGLNRFWHWERHTGTVLVSAAAITGMAAITMVCVLNTKEFEPLFDGRTRNMFSDYFFGTGYLALLAFGGIHLILRGNRLDGTR